MAPGVETVCVTGAGGFIASWIVKLLLEKGYVKLTPKATPECVVHETFVTDLGSIRQIDGVNHTTREDNGAPRVPEYPFSTKKVREELGIEFEPLEDVLRETIECFSELKYLH